MYIISDDIYIEAPCAIGANIAFSQPFRLGAYSHLNGGFIKDVSIGRYCSIARDVQIGHGFHPDNWLSVNPIQYFPNYRNWRSFSGKMQSDFVHSEFNWSKHTTIGNDVWIGNHVIIKDGVNIGDRAIIGAGSIVTKDVEPYSVVAGNPAKIIRYRFDHKVIEALQNIEWWKYDIYDFMGFDFSNIKQSIQKLEYLIAEKILVEFHPKSLTSNDIKGIVGR